jgi:hypothetical protein
MHFKGTTLQNYEADHPLLACMHLQRLARENQEQQDLIHGLLGRVGTLEERISTMLDKAQAEQRNAKNKAGWFGGMVGPQAASKSASSS